MLENEMTGSSRLLTKVTRLLQKICSMALRREKEKCKLEK